VAGLPAILASGGLLPVGRGGLRDAGGRVLPVGLLEAAVLLLLQDPRVVNGGLGNLAVGKTRRIGIVVVGLVDVVIIIVHKVYFVFIRIPIVCIICTV
jgi:hypothetical protein